MSNVQQAYERGYKDGYAAAFKAPERQASFTLKPDGSIECRTAEGAMEMAKAIKLQRERRAEEPLPNWDYF